MSGGPGAQIKAALALLRGDPTADRAVPPSGTTGYLTTGAAGAMILMAQYGCRRAGDRATG